MMLNDPRLIKRAVNKPNQIYINLKEGKTADGLSKQDLQLKEERDRASAGEPDEKETEMDKETGGSPTKVDPKDTVTESGEVECGEIQEIGPGEHISSNLRSSAPTDLPTFSREKRTRSAGYLLPRRTSIHHCILRRVRPRLCAQQGSFRSANQTCREGDVLVHRFRLLGIENGTRARYRLGCSLVRGE